MERNVSVAEAKAHFSDCLREVEDGSSLIITRHGKPVAALVRASDVEHLERLRKAGPQGGLASIAGGWKGSEELADILDSSRRRGQRNVPQLGS